MIVGVDHIAMSCPDLAIAGKLLESNGFTCRFAKPALENDEAKRPFVARWSPTHGIAFYSAASGVSIELTRHHGDLGEGPSPYGVLFAGSLRGGIERTEAPSEVAAAFSTLSELAPVRRCWPEVAAELWHVPDPHLDHLCVRAIMVPARDLDASVRFWTRGVGCKVERAFARGALLQLRSPVAAWALSIVLWGDASTEAREPLMDDPGFPVLAVHTNRIDADIDRLAEAGARARSIVFQITPSTRPTRVAIVRGPSGELVELVEVGRRDSTEQNHG